MQERSDLVTSVINGCARFAASRVNAGWVAEMAVEIWQHRFARCIANRCGSVVIEINHQFFLLILVLLVLVLVIVGAPGDRALQSVAASLWDAPNELCKHSIITLRTRYRIGCFHF